MKPGDLMQVAVTNGAFIVDMATGHVSSKMVPDGTPVIVLGFLEEQRFEGGGVLLDLEQKVIILVDGRQGWVYADELERIE
jgi:hypothetical protein